MKNTLSIAEARRIALAAQGFNRQTRDGNASWTGIKPYIGRMKLLQIDSVNVLTRSHYLPVFSRAGSYAQGSLDERTFGSRKRAMFECWAHVASLVPLELHPLMRWRMIRARKGDGIYSQMDRFGKENRAYLKAVLKHVREHGPTAVSDFPESGKGEGGWWGWSKGKMALETLFDQGLVTTAARPAFERIYDLTERVIPSDILNQPTPSEPETFRRLLALGAEAHGIGTEFDLRDYFRLPVAETKRALAELLEEGTLIPVTVKDWKHQAYLHKDAKLPRKVGGIALLSPFDPLVWERSRTERLFNFHYRIEIYTPAPKRKFGYYVLPFLLGDRIAARLCLKSDRQASELRVNTAHLEPHADVGETAEALAPELARLAKWLGLGGVKIIARGQLAEMTGSRL
jgi:hypothetical protein